MKNPAKKILTAIIAGLVFLDAGISFAQNNQVIFYHHGGEIHSHDGNSAERKREFWEKFRESVKPREKHPEEERPHEVRPREVHPE